MLPVVGEKPKRESGFAKKLWRDATNDLDTVRRWFSHPQITGWGVHLGKSGLLVVDADPRKFEAPYDGDGLAYLESLIGPCDTFVVETGRGDGGVHVYYRNDRGLPGGKPFGPAIDVKTLNGYVVGVGSEHPDTGRLYSVRRDVVVADPPDVLVDRILAHAGSGSRSAPGSQKPAQPKPAEQAPARPPKSSKPKRTVRTDPSRNPDELRSLRLDVPVRGELPPELAAPLQDPHKGHRSQRLSGAFCSMLSRSYSIGQVFDRVVDTPAAQGHYGENGEVEVGLLRDIVRVFDFVTANPPVSAKGPDPELDEFLVSYEAAWTSTHLGGDTPDILVRVFLGLARDYGTREIRHSLRQLAVKASCDPSSASRHCQALVEQGWLTVVEEHTHDKGVQYRLTIPDSFQEVWGEEGDQGGQGQEGKRVDPTPTPTLGDVRAKVAQPSGDTDWGHDAFRHGALRGTPLRIILALAAAGGEIGMSALPGAMNLSERGVREQVARLEQLGVVERVRDGRYRRVRLRSDWSSPDRLDVVARDCGTAGQRAAQLAADSEHRSDRDEQRQEWKREQMQANGTSPAHTQPRGPDHSGAAPPPMPENGPKPPPGRVTLSQLEDWARRLREARAA